MKHPCLVFVVACMLTTGVSAQTRAYSNKNHLHVLADKTILSIRDSSVSLLEENQSGIASVAGIVLPPATDFVSAVLEAAATRDAKKYQATYSAAASSDHFYVEANEALLPVVTLKRWVKDNKGNDHLAVNITLRPELSADKTAFRFVANESFIYNYAIAKTTGRYDYLQLNLVIKVKSLSVQKEEYRISDLRTTGMQVSMVHVGRTRSLSEPVFSGWIPLPPPSTGKVKNSARDYVRLTGKTGLYEIEIGVTETNPYKVRAEEKQVIIKISGNQASDMIKAGIQSASGDQ